MTVREMAKGAGRIAAAIAVAPCLLSFGLRRLALGPDRAFEGTMQLLSLLPGVVGQYVRGAFLRRTAAGCHPTVTISFGTVFSRRGVVLDERVYVGPGCHLGLVHLERDVLVAAGVHIPSGADTHGFERLDVPIRDQPGVLRQVRIGRGAWIGSNAVVMADVGADTIVAAGSVVTEALPDAVIAGGVPARVIRARSGDSR